MQLIVEDRLELPNHLLVVLVFEHRLQRQAVVFLDRLREAAGNRRVGRRRGGGIRRGDQPGSGDGVIHVGCCAEPLNEVLHGRGEQNAGGQKLQQYAKKKVVQLHIV